ncbi:AI-2E family transporter [Paenibacillus harenae]|uniref:AI-2E family transporter n=1 Tax=Paenibacillus harenae TaxID=306543 RepID=UPI0027906146|nr:AI-2E family transporter [Paenibacillus harenae]MDQ0059887.1 putative PurR-regulated permease PerM [Paenibacillus harenae]
MVRLNHFIKICIAVFMVLAIVYVGSLVDFVFRPILSLVTIITVPLMLSVFFYYLLLPLVNWMEKKKINRGIAILLIYLAVAILLAALFIGVWPSLRTQLLNLLHNAPDLFNALNEQLKELEQSGFLADFVPADVSPLTELTNYLNKGFTFLTSYVTGFVSVISNIAVVLFIFPVILFYMLKESGGFGKMLVRMAPRRFHGDATEVVTDINQSLSHFIVGRVLINLALGVLMYIGFLIIGLPYALLLTVVAVIMNFIPFIGAILSAVPIVIIGFIESPSIAIWSLVVIFAAQQIQDNLIAPYVFGKQLDIHPVTTIVLVLVGGDLAGIIGILLIIPIYMIIKIIVRKVYGLFFKQKWEEA